MNTESITDFQKEVSAGERFEFGKNWSKFLSVLDDERIAVAEASISEMLGQTSLDGQSFIDIGSGSGLFSLAANRLGATKVHSLDYDPNSVACARELKRRYFPDSGAWTIEQGSALDREHLLSLGTWDLVYSWGVLHHTGEMWKAIDNVSNLVAAGGRFFISIYNDQGAASWRWKKVKAFYNKGVLARALVSAAIIPVWVLRGAAKDLSHLRSPFARYKTYKTARGMSRTHDWSDWLGGYPFEVAKPEEIFSFLQDRGFSLLRMRTCAGGYGCNEFVFVKGR